MKPPAQTDCPLYAAGDRPGRQVHSYPQPFSPSTQLQRIAHLEREPELPKAAESKVVLDLSEDNTSRLIVQ
jgi:hypothetical protein